MSEVVESKVIYTPEDFIRHTKYIQKRQFLFRYSALLTVAVFACILLFVYLINPSNFTAAFSKPRNILVLAVPMVFLAAWTLLKRNSPGFLLKRNLKKQFESSPALREMQFLSIDEEGLYGTNQFGSGQTKWEAMVEVTETEDDFFFFTSGKFAQFVPKRFFTPEQQNQIRDLAKRKLGERAKF
jgi:hypothetical protein